MRFMLDTNTCICIYIIKRKPPAVLTALLQHEAAGVGVSIITVCELAYGAAKSGSAHSTDRLQPTTWP